MSNYILPITFLLIVITLLSLLAKRIVNNERLFKLFFVEVEEDKRVNENGKRYLHIDLNKPLNKYSDLSTARDKLLWGTVPIFIGAMIPIVLAPMLTFVEGYTLLTVYTIKQVIILLETIVLTTLTPLSMLWLIYLYHNSIEIRKVEDTNVYRYSLKRGWIQNEE